MSETNGRLPLQRPTQKPAILNEPDSAGLTSLRNLLLLERLAFVLMLLVLVVSLTACAVTSTPSSEPAANPSPPPTTLSEHSETFSSRAQRSISEWRKKLTELLPK